MEETPSSLPPLLTGLGISQHHDHETGPSGEYSQSLVQHQLWPCPPSRALASPLAAFFVDHKSMALAAGRSPTSLSDTAVTNEPPTVWRRGGSLSRRRNISVPELSGKYSDSNLKSPTRGNFMDSPTIPGRPPLRTGTSDMVHHERSSSAPGNWRDGPFGDALTSCVECPTIIDDALRPTRTQWATVFPLNHEPFNPTRPLSPIFSPVEGTTPTTAVHISTFSPRALPDIPPKVPPKHSAGETPSIGHKQSQSLTSKASRPWLKKSPSKGSVTPMNETVGLGLSTSPSKSSLKNGCENVMLANSPPNSTSSSPARKMDGRGSPDKVAHDNMLMMDRNKPVKRSLRKQKSQPTMSKPPTPQPAMTKYNDLPPLFGPVQQDFEPPQMPTGLRPMEALLTLPEHEKALLRKQAAGQAEQFEVLGSKHVNSLSRELRALDERCDYLRKTYKSLRSGRQKLHTRMISYLKSESLIFSRERLLKQQEALIELDNSIDDWIEKLERAENRRLRLRQKLLEHVAAAMSLTMAHHSAKQLEEPTTPPRSPMQVASPKPLRVDRKEVESIKIYADNQVLNLFNDIEQAVTKMCEAC